VAWVPPNLEKGGTWYRDRMASLAIAVAGRPDAEQLLAEGEAALAIHRENYTEAGPKRLQLLWWEFPPEHWEALRLGSSMPSGHLEFNSLMDEQQLEVASQFVDELVGLGVLVEATEPLQANGPLFLVPKPGQPGPMPAWARTRLIYRASRTSFQGSTLVDIRQWPTLPNTSTTSP
jgi:hypothetical protein